MARKRAEAPISPALGPWLALAASKVSRAPSAPNGATMRTPTATITTRAISPCGCGGGRAPAGAASEGDRAIVRSGTGSYGSVLQPSARTEDDATRSESTNDVRRGLERNVVRPAVPAAR